MTGSAAAGVILSGSNWFRVRVVTCPAPQSRLAVPRADGERELFGVADHFEIASRRRGYVDREDFFKRLAGMKIGKALGGIQNANGSS
jgi:hypothetical protein